MASMVSSTASSACEIISSRAAKEPCLVRSCVGGGVKDDRGWRHAGLRLRLRESPRRRNTTRPSSMAAGGFVDGTTDWWAQLSLQHSTAKASTPAHVKAAWASGSASPCSQIRNINLWRTYCTKLW